MSSRVLGLDVGGDTTRFVEARLRGKVLEILRAEAVPSSQLAAAIAERGLKRLPTVVGVTGRDMILRTTFVPPVPDWQLAELMSYEVDDIAEQSGDKLVADYELLGGSARGGDEDLVLLALVRDSLVQERSAELSAAGLTVSAFTPNAIALHNAVVATDGGGGTVLAASLRGRNTDVAIIQDGELVFARNLTGGGDTFTEAVAEAFSVDLSKAEQAKRQLGSFPPQGETPTGQKGTVCRALDGALRQVVGMLQSTVGLCRSQLKAPDLEVDRVLLCGPGAAIEGLDQALTRALGLPTEHFDPIAGYVVDPAADPGAAGPDFAVAAGLAMMALLDGSYRVEILSDAARRRREFQRKTIWLVLAGVLLVAHLAVYGWLSSTNEAAASADRARFTQEASVRSAAQRDFDQAKTDVGQLAEGLTRIEEVTAPGAGLLLVLDLLDAYLPPELWVTAARTLRAAEPAFGWEGLPRPFLVIEGAGKEADQELSSAVVELVTRLRAHGDVIAGVVQTFHTDARGRFTFELKIDTSVRPSAAAAADTGDDEGAA